MSITWVVCVACASVLVTRIWYPGTRHDYSSRRQQCCNASVVQVYVKGQGEGLKGIIQFDCINM